MKKPKVLSAGDVLGIIPDSLLDQFAQDSGVDVQVKKLKGKTILQLFLYGALNFRTISQRILAAVYASDEFRMLFETTGNAVKFSAISMRLGNIKVSYFENIFNYLINSKQVSSVCFADTKVGIEKLDSTFLGLSSKLLKFGMDFNPGRKNLKFAVKLSGSIPIDIQLFTDSSEISEDRVFPKLLMEKQQKQALNIAIFDRGMNKRENFINLNQNNVYFISRFRNTYKTDAIKEIPLEQQTTKTLKDLQEQKIKFSNYSLKNATDKDSTFRLIKGTNKFSNEIIYF